VTPRVLMPGDEEGEVARIVACAPDAVLVRTLGMARALSALAANCLLVGDSTLNVANDLAVAAVLAAGMRRWTPAFEIDARPGAASTAWPPTSTVELVIYEHVPLFHTRYCPLAAHLSDGPQCGECGWHCRSHAASLRDTAGARAAVWTDGQGHTTVFAAAPRWGGEARVSWRVRGARHFRVELLGEPGMATGGLLDECGRQLGPWPRQSHN